MTGAPEPAAAAPPAVTLALVTYRRPEGLARALGGIAAQRVPVPWELLVVDNDPEGSARGLVEQRAASLAVPVRYVIESKRGAAHARNRAIADAAGDIVVMHDDDVTAPPGWLAALLAPVLAGEADCVGGPVVLDPAVVRPRWFDEHGVGQYLTRFDLGTEARAVGEGEYLVTANLACRTAALRASGGFDPRLGPRPGVQLVNDDVQLVQAVRRTGARIAYEPSAVVVHELPLARLDRRWLLRRAYWQGRSDWLLGAAELADRPLGGASRAVDFLRDSLRDRWHEGPRDPKVAFHAACDLARAAGALRESAGLVARRLARRSA